MNKLTPAQVSDTIKHDLKKRKLSLKELSRKLDITPQWMTRLLSGKDYIPPVWAASLAETLDYNVDFLTNGLGPLQKYTSDLDVLCELVRRYIAAEEKEHALNERWHYIKDSEYVSMEEKKQTLHVLRALKSDLFSIKSRIEIIINNR